ncbi:MAG TPA: ABC transporter permease [Gemmatimonadales bacterium]|nr:ABC transporter permease [Gemmatimonadales bacterium]
MKGLEQDLRYALRQLGRAPAFTAVAVLTLALGIGANTAMFSVAYGVLLRSLPYDRPERLVMVWGHRTEQPQAELSVPEYWDLGEKTRALSGVAAYADGSANLTGSGAPERLRVGYMTAGATGVLGIGPVRGRAFRPEEDLPHAVPVVLMSDGLWRRRFGADPAIVGRTLMLDDAPTTVIGIMPPQFQLPSHYGGPPMELWAPLQLDPATNRGERGWHFLNVVGRLRDGLALDAAAREASSLMRAMLAAYPTEYDAEFDGTATAVEQEVVGDVRPAILVLLGAVALLLLIACANVAGLLLARAEARQREIALRTALGAGRGRLVRQLLTESLLLAAGGGFLGMVGAMWGVRALVLAAPSSVPRLDTVGIDARVLTFTLGVTLLTGVLFGLAPALHAARPNLSGALVDGGRAGTAGAGRHRVRRMLVAAQVALALVLVTAAGLLVQSFLRLRHVDPGFRPERLLTARVELSPVRYATGADSRRFYRDLLERLGAIPSVRSAAAARALPMTGRLEIGDWSFVLEGQASSPPLPSDWHPADWQVVSPRYFETMGIPVLQGRGVSPDDRLDTPGAVVVNRTLAAQVWPDGDAVGKRVLLGGGDVDSVWRTVVGIVGDVRHRGLNAPPRPEMYLPYAQFPAGTGDPPRSMYVVLRTAADPVGLTGALRAAVASLDPEAPLSGVQTMEAAMGSWSAERRLVMLLVSGFALLALTLGAVGIYGVMSHLVSQREREIGVRIALGAMPQRILRMVLAHSAWLVGAGIVAGTIGSLAVTRLLAGLLFEVRPTDPVTFAGTAVILVLVAAGATVIPALRAVRTDPALTLRSD